MFFANNIYGERVHIDDAKVKCEYFCPACNSKMIQKRGNINAHHFSHKAGKECDPWYVKKLSAWHRNMQNQFSKSEQEIVIWNEKHTEYHIADVVLQNGDIRYVVEFQYSAITQKDFIARSSFYMQCGYSLIWVFDFCECKKPKRILITDDKYDDNTIRLVWPGRDRVSILDNIDFSGLDNRLCILFHIKTGKGRKHLHDPDGYHQWETWEYLDPFHLHPCFVALCLKDFTGSKDFFARYYSEEEFYKRLKCLSEKC